MSAFDGIVKKLAAKKKVVLSGAMGTEIQRRGVHTGLPLWSASALITNPEVVKQIHRDYIDAGAELITVNTFRTNVRAFKRAGKEKLAQEMTLRACALAQEARKDSGKEYVAIGGDIAPVEDCYEPSLVPSSPELEEEHGMLAEWLKEGGVDFMFVETMNCIREASIASRAAKNTGLPLMISFVCDTKGSLLSGESMKEAVDTMMPLEPVALLTNCRPLKTIEASIAELLKHSPVPVGIYANGDGVPDNVEGWKFEGTHPEHAYLEHVKQWLDKGVSIVGGCCGTTPEYIRLIAEEIKSR